MFLHLPHTNILCRLINCRLLMVWIIVLCVSCPGGVFAQAKESDEELIEKLVNLSSSKMMTYLDENPEVLSTVRQTAMQGNHPFSCRSKIIESKILFHQKKFHLSLVSFQTVLNTGCSLSTMDSLVCFKHMKECYIKLVNYTKAYEAYRQIEAIEKHSGIVITDFFDTKMSDIYLGLGMHEKAIASLRIEFSKQNRTDKDYTKKEANNINNLGVMWYRAGNNDSALYYYRKASKYVDKIVQDDTQKDYIKFFKGLIDGNIGQVLVKQGKYKEALPYLQNDITISYETNNFQNAAVSHNDIAQAHLKLKDYSKAKAHLDSSRTILDSIGLPMALLENYMLYSDLYAIIGNPTEEAKELRNYILLKDSLNKEQHALNQLNEELTLNLIEQEMKLKKGEQEILVERLKNEQSLHWRNRLLALILTLVVLLIASGYLFSKTIKRERLLQQKNQDIENKNKIINHSLHEKEMLLKEVHHRVKNNLQIVSSLLNLQAQNVENEVIAQQFTEAKLRVQSMAVIHQMLYQKEQMVKLSMRDYIDTLSDEIIQSYHIPGRKIILEQEIDDVNLDIDKAIPLGLILNELLTNALKHAFSEEGGTIRISLTKNDNQLTLLFADNGKGLPEFRDEKKEPTLGLELIRILTEQLEGTLTQWNESGAKTRLEFSV
jgi:two-component sensor histidine kinase